MKITNVTDYEKYIPLGDKVLLVLPRVEPEQLVKLDGILVDQAAALKKNPVRETRVVAIGAECKQVRPGDLVLFNKLNANPYPFGDNDLYFLPENHLICITERGPLVLCSAIFDAPPPPKAVD